MNHISTGHSPALKDVRQQFESWRESRASKRDRIPDHLWQAAVKLCREHSVYQVSKSLGLCSADLKKRIPEDTPKFMEIAFPAFSGQWQIECHRADGSVLRMSGSGQTPEIQTVLKSFLS